jgi:hypothetical protein
MLIALIRKDDASEIAREVADIEAARALATPEMPVFILEGGVKIPVDEYGREPEAPAETAEAPAPAEKAKAAPKKTAARKR